MLTLIAPGDPVFVSGMSGGAATVVKQNGSSVRVRMTSTEAVAWSRTARGGHQVELFDLDPDKGCLRWGLCDTGDRAIGGADA